MFLYIADLSSEFVVFHSWRLSFSYLQIWKAASLVHYPEPMFLRRYGYDDSFVVDLVVNIRLMIATEEHGFVGWSPDSTVFVVHLNLMFSIMKTFICQRRKKGHFFYKKLVCEVNFNDESFSIVFTYQEHEPGNQSQGTD